MPAYHIFGPAGSGKSTVCNELKRRGFRAIDTDFETGLSGWFNSKHQRITEWPKWPHPEAWADENFWLWDKTRMNELLDSVGTEPVFFCGDAYNEKDYYASFTKRFGLCVDTNTLTARLLQRERDLGRWVVGTPELEKTIRYNNKFRDLCRSTGAIEVDSSMAPDLVTDTILQFI